MEKLSSTLKQLLTEANISEAELARRTGIAQPMVNRLATGKNKNPKLETLKPIAKYFSVTFSQLLGEEDLPHSDKRADQFNNQSFQVPVINWDTINSVDYNNLDKATNSHMIATTAKVSSKAFAVLINNSEFEPRFPANTVLTIETETKANTNDFVLVKNANAKLTLGQIKIDNDKAVVTSLNSTDKTEVDAEQSNVVGVLIHTSYDFK